MPTARLAKCGPVSALAILGAMLAVAAPAAAADAVNIQRQEALAHPRQGDRVLHRESHWRYRQNGVRRGLVLYRCPGGQAFARKTLVERSDALSPDFDFEDARDGYREGVRTGQQGRVVYVRTQAGAEQKERALATPAGAVIDAGFDAGVRMHWDRLRAGHEVTQPFLIPSRMTFVPVRLSPGPTMRWRGVAAQRLTMRLDRWYGFVAPSMQLVYAGHDQRLLEFAGIATIRDGAGKHQDVRIVFPEAAAVADVQALQAALDTPLVRGCAR